MENSNYYIWNDECLSIMRAMEANSIDTCITDPPYHLTSITKRFGKDGSAPAKFAKDGSFSRLSKGFMNKKWDGGDIAFQPKTWEEVWRVMKPGGFLLAFGGTRTYHRLVCAIEDAGFEIRDTIGWVYGTGFPKNKDISKDIDKKLGATRKVIGKKPNADDIIRRNKPKPGNKDWDRECRYDQAWLDSMTDITEPATPEAKLWDGWGTALKPAMELICVAQKPFPGSYAENALKEGTAGLWIDGGRVPGEPIPVQRLPKWSGFGELQKPDYQTVMNEKGRFPSNFIHDGSEEVLQLLPENAGRFFYCAKATKKEKNSGLEGKENIHPTVKPLALMQYLARLTKTPTGGTVLDPFMGSGTTGIGALLEGRSFIGIEMDEEYFQIANNRLKELGRKDE